ncbi:phage regulatory protein/antirepressor Ant [Bacteroides ovatus]|jgi:anti-repressor protein|uniref:phage regulatory protein/antirepressor Ant n=2 Tax=Bacteroides ovatus TaxID=28116 RepID=UPI0024811C49|nr:phage regulatory protein/antirepressor Ant [Bacteroides ovatus]MDC2381293.1 phage regulatory protein/antirepressor Ant [Bacteroides ovatus]
MVCVKQRERQYTFFLLFMLNNTINQNQTNNSSLMATLIHDTDRMSSLEIAELTGKQHAHIMRDIRSLLAQEVSQSNFGLSSYKQPQPRGGYKELPCFELTKKGCLILASGYDAVLREKIIDRWEQLELEKRKPQTPQTYLEALKALVSSEEEKQRLAQEKKQLEQQNAKLQPKADFADAAFATDDKVDIGMSAKILKLGFGHNTLFDKLRKAGVFFANRNEPKQRFIDAGYFEMKEKFIERNNHPGFVVTKVLVTQKGLAYLNHLFGGKISDGKLVRIV